MARKKTNAEFVAEVRALVGDEYTFLDEYKHSQTKLCVKHNKCGFEYLIIPNNFLRGKRCPKCAGVVKKTDAEFKSEVKALVGDEYEVLGKYINTRTKIRFSHSECGHSYFVKPSNFLSGKRCPKCAVKVMSKMKLKTDSEFKDEVKALTGSEYIFLGEYKNSQTDLRVLHNKCGHEYLTKPNNFLNGARCPKCSESKGEKAVGAFLESSGISYTAQFQIKYAKNKYPLRIDYLAEGVAIEYDGEQHFEAIEAWGGERGLRETQRRDRIKNEYCAKHGIPMIRIPYWDFDRIDEILTDKLLPIIRNKDDKLA